MSTTHTVLQITDPHLSKDDSGRLLGMRTQHGLETVVARIQKNAPNCDLLLATGDIAQEPVKQAYSNFLNIVDLIKAPLRWIPGNHDQPSEMAGAANERNLGETASQPVYLLGKWVIVLLNSRVEGKIYGRLDQSQLALLNATLEAHKDKHALVCLHHHLIPMNSQWLDQHDVKNSAEVIDILKTHTQVKAVVCGHVHQEYDQVHDGIRYLATPSTCVQFTPASDHFGVDDNGPGYRELTLHDNGHLTTQVVRITDMTFDIDLANTIGY